MRRRIAAVALACGLAIGSASAQPAPPAGPAASPAAARSGDAVLYPHAVEAPGAAKTAGSANGPMTVVLVVLLGAGGGWALWNRLRMRGPIGQGGQRLVVAETKSLGNRQFLVVASYRDRKFLLGVCPGRIDLLSALDGDEPEANPKKFSL